MLTRRIRAAFAVASALLLAGCASAQPFPDGPTDAEARAYLVAQLDAQWEMLDGSGAAPPATTLGEFVPREEYVEQYTLCQAEQEASAVRGEFVQYTCAARNPLDPRIPGGLVSDAQADYLYDYFATWLVPCLDAHGYRFTETVPTRAQFVAGAAAWNPTNSVISIITESDRSELFATCAPLPEGMFPGWF